MKGQVAANAVAIASLAREGFGPAGDLIFAATADEEVGDGFGLSWLCEEHPDAVRCDYAVNEGGGDRLELGGGVYYVCCDRREDDGAVPHPRARPLRARVDARRSPTTRSSRRRGSSSGIAAYRAGAADPAGGRGVPADGARRGAAAGAVARARARGASSSPRELVEPLLAPTLRADDDLRVAEAERHPGALRGRGRLPAPAGADAGGASSRSSARCSATTSRTTSSSSRRRAARARALDTPLWAAVEAFVARDRAGRARGADHAAPGFTDSHWLREAFGTVAYGFFPYRGDAAPSSPRRSSTRPTSGCRSTTSSSGSTGCATPREPSCG